jgi:hypothetical protein
LSAGKGQSQSFLAGEQRTHRQRIQHTDEACIVERDWSLIQVGRSGRFARRQKLERTRDIAAETIEKSEIIAARNAERSGGRVPLALFRQKTTEERTALTPAEWLHAFRQ